MELSRNEAYTFVSLGPMESFGFRLGGGGLGNMLLPWARAQVYAKTHNLTRIKTTWPSLKVGPLLRGERDLRLYSDVFSEPDGLDGWKKFAVLQLGLGVRKFSGVNPFFEGLVEHQPFIRDELMRIIKTHHLDAIGDFRGDGIGVHIRMGDFQVCTSEEPLRSGAWNHRIPLAWYTQAIEKTRRSVGKSVPVHVFSDAADDELEEILSIEGCERQYFGSGISDMLALAKTRVIISSASTFSMWSSFLGQRPTVWFPGQLRQSLMNGLEAHEIELDYDEELPAGFADAVRDCFSAVR